MAIMISIQPQHCGNILNKDKILEIRTTCPREWKDYLCGKAKVKPEPMKCVIYCTKKQPLYKSPESNEFLEYYSLEHWNKDDININGKIVAEFTLNEVTRHLHNFIDAEDEECYNFLTEDAKNAGFKTDLEGLLDFDRFIEDYGKGKPLYAWHIDDLQIYDTPKELGGFKHWVHDEDYDGWNERRTRIEKGYVLKSITRPFQSWGYCEELEDKNE